ncbi:MAG: hypothetical protein ABSB80_09765 [Methanoregula sp.]|uniref:hypothetical protein n=1 Tax=Methanoregula sp. TaxID=2052170 RepID=UPI003D1481C5
MTKKIFPSQERYLKNNPSVTFRLKKDEKEKLDSIIKETGKPLSKWMSDFILNKLAPYEETSKLVKKITVLEAQKKELAGERRFNVPCPVCGKTIFFSSKDSNWKSETYPELIRTFSEWHHADCKPSKSPSLPTTPLSQGERTRPTPPRFPRV